MANITKTDFVKKNIIDEIICGILAEDEKISTEAGFIEKYNVSRVTVRRALAELFNEKIIYKKPSKKGYFVRPGQVQRDRKIHRSIGILIHYNIEKSHPFMHRFLTSASKRCAENNIGHQIFNLSNNGQKKNVQDETAQILGILKEHPVDGFLIDCRLSDETLQNLEKITVPAVIVNNYLPGSEIPHIIAGYRAIGTAVEHLHHTGHKKIAFITGPQDERIVHETIWDFQNTCKALSLPYENALIKEGAYNEEKVKENVEELLSLKPRPTAVIIDDDIMACHAIRFCREKGLNIPGDIGIVGIGGVEMGEFLTPALTTVHLPIEEAAGIGIEMLLKLIMGKKLNQKFVLLKGTLVIRQSCG